MDQITNPRPDLYIGGEWRRGRGAEIESHFPADGSLNAVVSGASIEDVDFAIERAQEAVSDKAWRRLLPHERATYLYRIADGIAQHADRISQVQTRDTGKTLTETHKDFYLTLFETTAAERQKTLRDSEMRRLRRSV